MPSEAPTKPVAATGAGSPDGGDDIRRSRLYVLSRGTIVGLVGRAVSIVALVVADVLGLDLTDPASKARVKTLLKTWIENKALKVVQRPDESRHDRPFIEVDQWANS